MSNEVIAEFWDSGNRFIQIAKSVSSEKLHKSNQNDEWSPANIIHHIADAEAHFYVRYLRVLTENLPTTEFFDENVTSEGFYHVQYISINGHRLIGLG